MQNNVRKDILYVLNRAIEILEIREEKDLGELKELSNKTIHNASIHQDFDSLSISIITYSAFKLIERGISEKEYSSLLSAFKGMKNSLEKKNLGRFNSYEKTALSLIEKCDKRLNLYTQEIIEKGRIKKGSKLFQHGLSASKAADILGITKWELLNYLGKTKEIEKHPLYGLKVEERLKKAFEAFGI